VGIVGCKKFNEDEGIQWENPRERLSKPLWRISYYQINGIDSSLEKINSVQNKGFQFTWDPEYDWVSYKIRVWTNPQMEIGTWTFLDENLLGIGIDTSQIIPQIVDSSFINTISFMEGAYKINKLSDYTLKIQKDPNTFIEFRGGPF
jgi:hypothetical protein